MLPQFSSLVLYRQPGSVGLHGQREDIARDEDFGHPGGADNGETLAVNTANQTSEHHVYGSSVEDGREEDETALDGVRRDLVGVVVTI